MNEKELKIFTGAIVIILFVWIAVAWTITNKTEALRQVYNEKSLLLQHYRTLQSQWSQKSQKSALEKFEHILRLYRVTPTVKKRHGTIVYTFTLDKKRADKVFERLLNAPLTIKKLTIERVDDTHLHVTLGVRR